MHDLKHSYEIRSKETNRIIHKFRSELMAKEMFKGMDESLVYLCKVQVLNV